ncbi:MAG: substrate-binding domain-containing protein [Tepidisphaeraceae bacterium]
MTTKRRVRVLVVMDSTYACYREMQIGIADFANARTAWHIDLFPAGSDLLSWIKSTEPDGLILGPASELSIDEVDRAIARLPASVAISTHPSIAERVPSVDVDNEQVGRIAAEHFLNKSFEHFGYIASPASAWWAIDRFAGFKAAITAAGFTVDKWETHYSHLHPEETIPVAPLPDWLQTRPKPFAVLACNDSRAWECTQVCEDVPLHIPHDIALLGVDNDDLYCRMSRPALSSVIVPWERMGFQAATLLDELLQGKAVAPGVRKLLPTGVCERQSSDVIAVPDPDVREALRFIRKNADRAITVKDVVDAVPVSRRDLEQRFRRLLNRSPLEEIRAARLARAKLLLATTDMSIDDVAYASGFASVHRFDHVFKAFFACTPTQYRRQSRH